MGSVPFLICPEAPPLHALPPNFPYPYPTSIPTPTPSRNNLSPSGNNKASLAKLGGNLEEQVLAGLNPAAAVLKAGSSKGSLQMAARHCCTQPSHVGAKKGHQTEPQPTAAVFATNTKRNKLLSTVFSPGEPIGRAGQDWPPLPELLFFSVDCLT